MGKFTDHQAATEESKGPRDFTSKRHRKAICEKSPDQYVFLLNSYGLGAIIQCFPTISVLIMIYASWNLRYKYVL